MKTTLTVGSTTITIDTLDADAGDEMRELRADNERLRAVWSDAEHDAADALNIGRADAPGLPAMICQIARQRDEALRERADFALRLRDTTRDVDALQAEVARLTANAAAVEDDRQAMSECWDAAHQKLIAVRTALVGAVGDVLTESVPEVAQRAAAEVARLTQNLAAETRNRAVDNACSESAVGALRAEVERLTRERDEARAATRAARDESDNWRAASVDMRALIGCEPGERVDDAARRVIRERDEARADNNTTPLRCALHAALGMGPGEAATQDALVRRAAHLLERAQFIVGART